MERTLLIFWFTVDCARPSAFAISPCVNPNSLILSLIFFELIGVFLASLLFVLQKRQICAILEVFLLGRKGAVLFGTVFASAPVP